MSKTTFSPAESTPLSQFHWFTDLPPELRSTVYQFAIGPSRPPSLFSPSSLPSPRPYESFYSGPIIYVSKQIYQEVIPIIYSSRMIYATIRQKSSLFSKIALEHRDQYAISHIRHVHIDVRLAFSAGTQNPLTTIISSFVRHCPRLRNLIIDCIYPGDSYLLHFDFLFILLQSSRNWHSSHITLMANVRNDVRFYGRDEQCVSTSGVNDFECARLPESRSLQNVWVKLNANEFYFSKLYAIQFEGYSFAKTYELGDGGTSYRDIMLTWTKIGSAPEDKNQWEAYYSMLEHSTACPLPPPWPKDFPSS